MIPSHTGNPYVIICGTGGNEFISSPTESEIYYVIPENHIKDVLISPKKEAPYKGPVRKRGKGNKFHK